MNIPQMKVGPQQRPFMQPNPSYFKYRIEVRDVASMRDGQTNSPSVASDQGIYQTRCHFQVRSMREVDDDGVLGAQYDAQALVRMVSGIEQIDEGWKCAVHEPAGKTEWDILGTEWPFGFRSKYVLLRLRKSTDAVMG